MEKTPEGQLRLDRIVHLVARSMVAEVCSIYLMRPGDVLELAASEGLNIASVRRARLLVGEGLVGVIARDGTPINSPNARTHPDFRYLPETGEERFSSFLGVPVQRLGKIFGVLVVQNERPQIYTDAEIEALELVAAVVAEMAAAGALKRHVINPDETFYTQGRPVSDGLVIGRALLHDKYLALPNPIAEDTAHEFERLEAAIAALRQEADRLLDASGEIEAEDDAPQDIMQAYRLFAYDKVWLKRLGDAVRSGLSAEAAVDKARSDMRLRFDRASDPHLREKLQELEAMAEALLRILLGVEYGEGVPPDAILLARHLGPAELLNFSKGQIKGIVLEEGSAESHVAVVARALGIPLVVQAREVLREVEMGDQVILNADDGVVHLRPRPDVLATYREKIAFKAQEQAVYVSLRDRPCITRCKTRIHLEMNGGLLTDLTALEETGAEGIGLWRTELQFMVMNRLPGRERQQAFYRRIMEGAGGRPVIFRTLDIGSDKLMRFMRHPQEHNPALGWRAIRVGLDRPGLLKMQAQALLRASVGFPSLSIMFPMVADEAEFDRAREMIWAERDRMRARGEDIAPQVKVGAVLETPSLIYASDAFYREVDFFSIGGNDLMQFFFAADRMNDATAGRYDPLHPAFLRLLQTIVERCRAANTPLSFCGEAAAHPPVAARYAALGLRRFSVRPAAIGPLRSYLMNCDLRTLLREMDLEGMS